MGTNEALRYASDAADGIDADRKQALETLARVGYFAKGVVYAVLGGVSTWAAIEAGGQVEGSRGALETVLQQPFGRVLLGILAIGLACYVVWRLVQAAVDPEVSRDDRSIITRAYYTVSAIAYGALTVYAVRLLFSDTSSSSSSSASDYFLGFVPREWLTWVLALVGIAVLVAAARNLVKAVSASFMDRLNLGELNSSARDAVLWIGRAGLTARAAVFVLIGLTFLSAGLTGDSSPEQVGTADALERIGYLGGTWALAAVAVGLFAYGAYQMVKGRYRRIALE